MSNASLDISANREAVKYTKSELVRRALWTLALPLFRYSPRICFGWRRFLLRMFGATIGQNTHIYGSAIIYMPWNLTIGNESSIGEWALVYNLGLVTIGNKTTISHRAHICAGTHDYTRPDLPLKKPSITISDQVWVCADAFVGPGVLIGDGAIVGAKAAVMKDVASWTVVAGNPARLVKNRIIVLNEK